MNWNTLAIFLLADQSAKNAREVQILEWQLRQEERQKLEEKRKLKERRKLEIDRLALKRIELEKEIAELKLKNTAETHKKQEENTTKTTKENTDALDIT